MSKIQFRDYSDKTESILHNLVQQPVDAQKQT